MPLSESERLAFATDVARDGWAVTPPLIPQLAVDQLLSELTAFAPDGRGGVRNLLDASPAVRALARSDDVRSVAEAVLGPTCFAVRAILFDKTPDANWKVVWHQDLSIAVSTRADVEGYGPWSEKAGVLHVQPPAAILERMLAVRVHLDDCDSENGPVRVLTGSHTAGRLGAAAIDEWRGRVPESECLAERGAILAFHPLILHASSPARTPRHRRVLHLDFAAATLPEPLGWHSQVM